MDAQRSRSRRLAVAVGVNLALAGAQLGAGLAGHSVGLLADAGHNVTDVAGLAVSLVAVRLVSRPRSPERSFGYHRSSILAALANATVIAAVTMAIAVGALLRLLHPRPVDGGLMVVVAGVGLLANGVLALVLREGGDLNMRSAALHMAGDALASLAVVVAGALLTADPALRWADPAASLAVALLIVVEAYRLLRAAVEVLLESSPADVDLERLTDTMREVPGVAEVHDLHVWSLSSEVRALSAHLVVTGHPSLEEAQAVGDQVKAAVGGPFAIAHTTLELECERCNDEDDPCLMDGLVVAPPRRAGR
ncbi:MAG: cation transporter [Acidobacteriota bacterium]|nr:cation transporter [Acidobacteriota bacterium]